MNTAALQGLVATWRAEVEYLARRGLEHEARFCESFAAELEESIREWKYEELTLEAAAEESGYSYSRLQHLVAGDALPNVGEKGSPRIRRCDIPVKPQRAARNGTKLEGAFVDRMIDARSGA